MRRLLPLIAFGALFVLPAMPAHAADSDGDTVADEIDVCPTVADPFQSDIDGDGVGDLCEPEAAGVTTFEGTAEGEVAIGTSGDDTLSGAGGDDALYGLEGDDSLDGGDGSDFLAGGPGTDTLAGGGGCDVFAFDPAGDDDIIADFNPEQDRMSFPSSGADSGSNPLAGASFGGDDHLVVTFGEGDNAATLEFEALPAGVEVALSTEPCFTPPVEEDESPPLLPPLPPPPPEIPPFLCTPIFQFEIPPTIFNTDVPLDGVQLFGNGTQQTLTGTKCSDAIVGDATVDLFSPYVEEPTCPDNVCSDDVINGLGGNDLLIGDKTELFNETGGDDIIRGGFGDDVIFGDSADIADCTCGPIGEAGSTGLDHPGGGDDLLYGDQGDDSIVGDAEFMSGLTFGGNDFLSGGDGKDVLIGDAIFMDLGAVAGDDLLDGGDGDDVLIGDAVFIGSGTDAGRDTLVGGAGDDMLVGDSQNLMGAAAEDTFVYDADTDFGDDAIVDAGIGGVADNVLFTGDGLGDIADLDARSTVSDDGTDVFAQVFTNAEKNTLVGSITFLGIGMGGSGAIQSWADLDSSGSVNVVVAP